MKRTHFVIKQPDENTLEMTCMHIIFQYSIPIIAQNTDWNIVKTNIFVSV